MTDPQALQQPIELLQEALKGLPVLAVMWYMLKDVRSGVRDLASKVAHLELKIAGDDSRVRLDHLNEKLNELRAECQAAHERFGDRLILVEQQMPKIWAKIGDRPEDIQQRRGAS